jgi:uncharacterized protein YjiS (DUF1127 family)
MTRTRDVLDDLAEWYALPASAAAAAHGAYRSRPGSAQAKGDLRSAVRNGFAWVIEALLAWHDRARERRALMQLSDQMLRDIGISRARAQGEAARPFWRV